MKAPNADQQNASKQPEAPAPKRAKRTLEEQIADLQQKQHKEQLRLQLRAELDQLAKDCRVQDWYRADTDIITIGGLLAELKALREQKA